MNDEDSLAFSELWADYTEDHLGKRAELHVPEDFGRADWESVGYMPPDRRSENEVYSWSQFYDFYQWLKSEGYIE